jgi:hypothetical protein
VTVRPGLARRAQLASKAPIESLIPFYGGPDTMAIAAEGKVYASDAVTVIRTGFTSNYWQWTSLSNLGAAEYTVMVNGADGVWSWNGALAAGADAGVVTVTSLSNSNPAKCTVAAADLSKFQNGMSVVIAGATGTGMTAANGTKTIANVGAGATTTFELVGVNTSAGAAAQTTGVTADPPGAAPLVKETVTAPPGKPYVNPNLFHTVLSHMNRLWFADTSNLALYYLPLQQKSGELKELPLNALFRRGGAIRAIYNWTIDGGAGIDDQLVIFSTNGEAVIYNGIDPDSADAWNLTGIFRFDSPLSMRSVIQYGGDLYVFVSTGLVPMSTMLRAESEQLGSPDKNVADLFVELTTNKDTYRGWEAILDHNHGWAILNFPTGAANVYRQMVRFMPDPVWATWSGIPARCWQWVNKQMFCGSDDGTLYELRRDALNDNGRPITADVQPSWSAFNTAAVKAFKMINPYIISDGTAAPYVDIRVDYDTSLPLNQPSVSVSNLGATWDTATWDVDYWTSAMQTQTQWTGVAGLGRVAAPRMRVSVIDCNFSLAGFDVLYETGGAAVA